MKKKLILITLCLAAVTFLFASCAEEEPGNGDNDNQNQNQTQSCTHIFTEGICVHCGESDPNYNQGGSDGGNSDQKPGEGGTEPEVPPIDIGGETELPFVPAK